MAGTMAQKDKLKDMCSWIVLCGLQVAPAFVLLRFSSIVSSLPFGTWGGADLST